MFSVTSGFVGMLLLLELTTGSIDCGTLKEVTTNMFKINVRRSRNQYLFRLVKKICRHNNYNAIGIIVIYYYYLRKGVLFGIVMSIIDRE